MSWSIIFHLTSIIVNLIHVINIQYVDKLNDSVWGGVSTQ